MVVTEDLSSVAGPDVFPNILGIHAYAVYEPLGIVVEGHLSMSGYLFIEEVGESYVDLVRAAFGSAPQKRM